MCTTKIRKTLTSQLIPTLEIYLKDIKYGTIFWSLNLCWRTLSALLFRIFLWVVHNISFSYFGRKERPKITLTYCRSYTILLLWFYFYNDIRYLIKFNKNLGKVASERYLAVKIFKRLFICRMHKSKVQRCQNDTNIHVIAFKVNPNENNKILQEMWTIIERVNCSFSETLK